MGRALNLLLLLFAAAVFLQRLPVWTGNYQAQGEAAPRAVVQELSAGRTSSLSLPIEGPQMIVFWATWCGPCRLELKRIKRMVENGEIPKERVLAVSFGERQETVESHLRREPYPFRVALDSDSAASRLYSVAATPTLLLIDKENKISWKTTGLSPSLELRARSFFSAL